jgi:hypothetical protein
MSFSHVADFLWNLQPTECVGNDLKASRTGYHILFFPGIRAHFGGKSTMLDLIGGCAKQPDLY